MTTSTENSAYRFTRHADEYAVTTREGGGMLGIVRRTGKTWTAYPHSTEQGAHLYVTEHHTRHNAAIALDAAALIAGNEAPVETTAHAETLAPGMYRVRVTVTNRDGVHTATEDMNPAAIELARSRPGWSVEILGEAQVTIVADEEDTPAEQAPAGTVRLIGIGNVPAVPLSDVRPGDRITWNYGQTYTVVRNTKVAANTYELVERGEDGREWTRRKRGTKLVARRPAVTPPAVPAPADRPARTLAPLTRERWEALTPTGHCDCGACICTCPACKTPPLAADARTVTGTPENIDARASARARGELATQAPLTFDESDRQAMTGAQLRATAGDALALF